MNELAPIDGEIQAGPVSRIDPGSALMRAEIDLQISTARQYPRPSDRNVAARITSRATFDEETAQECLYALVRGKKKAGRDQSQGNKLEDRENKPIEGPSIRLAEIAAQAYGNCRIDARVVRVDRTEKYVEAEGIFHDLETNMASRATVRRNIGGRYGLFSDDMITMTGNAACAIAKRNAILAGIPKALYRQAYLEARRLVAGDASSLSANRDKALAAFARYGVTPAQVIEAIGVESVDGITVDHIATLRGMFASIRNGEATVEDMFSPRAQAAAFDKVDNPLADDDETAGVIVSAIAKDQDGEAGRTVDPVPVARERGGQAFRTKMTRKAVPPEYREAGREAEAHAWLEGFDEAKAAKAEGGNDGA